MQKFLSPADSLPTSADVIILGGGPAGTAAAWALERLQPGIRTLIIERSGSLGAGSSRASLECFRTCWPARCQAHLMRRSIAVFMHADDEIAPGAHESIHPRQRGYVWCAFSERQAAALRADVAHLHSMGMDFIEYLDGDEVRRRFPWLGARVVGAKFDPTAGWLDSNALIYAFIKAASGAQVLLGCPDARLRMVSGTMVGVETHAGIIHAPRVLLAAGAWSVGIARAAGLALPVVVRPRQSFTTGWRHDDIPDHAPMIIGSAPFPHLRPEAGSGAIFGWEYHVGALDAPVSQAEALRDARFPSITLTLLARQFGHAPGQGFADPRYLRNVAHNIGYYVYRGAEAAYRLHDDGTRAPYESERAIIDAHPDVPGLFLSVAHSGHGIMSAPGAGELAARRLLGLPQTDPVFDDFGIGAHWVAHDENAL